MPGWVLLLRVYLYAHKAMLIMAWYTILEFGFRLLTSDILTAGTLALHRHPVSPAR